MVGMDANYVYFMKADLSAYLDEWVAIVDAKVVAHGKEAKAVFEAARKAHPAKQPLLARVPGVATMIL